jgi:redox-sensitive bicupin YhaK (pirin superfamily)
MGDTNEIQVGAGAGDPSPSALAQTGASITIEPAREAKVGSTTVRRALPRRARRTVGAWCFADHFGPAKAGLGAIGPHPHIGLQTVTWLLDGHLLHRDSLGSEQPIRPGQLNLMTAGHGIAHAEEADLTRTGSSHGTQLWVALPESTRNGDAAFEHLDDLPRVDLGDGTATLLIGGLAGPTGAGLRSRARADTDHFGAEVDLRGTVGLDLDSRHEHAIYPLDDDIEIEGRRLSVGQVAYLPPSRTEVTLSPVGDVSTRGSNRPPTRVMLLGGVPFHAEVFMWWNYVARSRDEVDEANQAWGEGSDRFGDPGSALTRIPAPTPPWSRATD